MVNLFFFFKQSCTFCNCFSRRSCSAQCGQAKTEPCRLPNGLAQVVSTENGAFKVENVSEACPNAWPWQASLQSEDTHYCSGVLVHPRWVLAPRHCLVK